MTVPDSPTRLVVNKHNSTIVDRTKRKVLKRTNNSRTTALEQKREQFALLFVVCSMCVVVHGLLVFLLVSLKVIGVTFITHFTHVRNMR